METCIFGIALGLCLRFVFKHNIIRHTGIAVLFLCLGMALMTLSANDLDEEMPKEMVRFQAVVMNKPKAKGKVVRTDLWAFDEQGNAKKVRASLSNYDQRASKLQVLDGIEAVCYLENPKDNASLSPSYARYLRYQGYKATCFIGSGGFENRQVSLKTLPKTEYIRLRMLRQREDFINKLRRTRLSKEAFQAASAMSLGDRGQVDDQTQSVYKASGAAHVLALSGLHLMMIYFIVSLFIRLLLPPLYRDPVMIVLIWGYVFLVGMPITAVRAAAMLTIYAFVNALNRDKIPLNTLSLMLFVMLVANPLNLFSASFQLSVMAVVGIMAFQPTINSLFPRKIKGNIAGELLAGCLSVSLAAQIGTAPLIAFYFGNFTPYACLGNIVISLTVPFVLFFSIMILALPFGFVQDTCAVVVNFFVELLNSSLHAFASLPSAMLQDIRMSVSQVLLIYAMEFLALLLVEKVMRIHRELENL